MKKTLSILLTLALLISCSATVFLSVPASADSSVDYTAASSFANAINEECFTKIFDSSEMTDASWIEADTDFQPKGSVKYDEFKQAISLGNNTVTKNILATNVKSENTAVLDEMVWEFEYAPQNTQWAATSFEFHVSENTKKATVSSSSKNTLTQTTNRSKMFAVSFYGTDASMANDFRHQNALVLEGDVNDTGAMRPMVGYTSSTEISENAYIPLDLQVGEFYKVRVSLINGTITVECGKANDYENTKQSLVYKVATSYYSRALNGDFAIAQTNCGSYVRNMKIYRPSLILDKNTTDNKGEDWLASANTVAINDKGSFGKQLSEYCASTAVLKHNQAATDSVGDFVWELEYLPSSTNWANIAFCFHVNENSTWYEENNNTKMVTRQNLFAIRLLGNTFTAGNDALPRMMGIETSSSSTDPNVVSADYYTADNIRVPRSITPVTWENVWYTVRIVMKGKIIYAYIWQTDKPDTTLTSVMYEANDARFNRASIGDFSIVQGNTKCNIKNMKIWDTTDVLLSDEDYSSVSDCAKTVYNSDNAFSGITSNFQSENHLEGSVEYDASASALKLDTPTDKHWSLTSNFDNGNTNIGDFILKFDYTAANHNWITDYVAFRSQNANNQYRLRIDKNGADNDANFDFVSISKVVDGQEEYIAYGRLSRSLTKGGDYTVKLVVQNNCMAVYFAPKGTVYTQPVLIAYDDTYSAGTMYFSHMRGTAYISEMVIYDLTTNAMVKSIEALSGGIVRSDRTLAKKLSSVNTVQAEKLSGFSNEINALNIKIAELEKAAMDADGNDEVDIRDLVRLKKVMTNAATEHSSALDPCMDDEKLLNSDDLRDLKLYILGMEYYF